jgi:hypothetical protein
MAEYLLRKGKLFYELAKFEDSAEPTAIYVFTKRGCSCPSRYSSCKHSKILKAWKEQKELPGIVYDDNANIIGRLEVY